MTPWLLALGLLTAETLPPGTSAVHLDGGLMVIGIQVPPLPYFPVLTGDAEVGWGLVDGLDVRARYQTHAGLVHRLGPEVRGRILAAGGLSGAARVWATGSVAGAYEDELDAGGDLATLFGGVLTWRGAPGALSLDAGLQVQWLLYQDVAGDEVLDTTPFPAFVELALTADHPLHEDVTLSLRLEYAVPLAPDDPFTVFGGYPRLVMGGSWAL